MRTKIIIGALVLLGLTAIAGFAAFWIILAPNTKIYKEPRSLKIPPGSGFESVVDSLKSSGVLRSADTFSLLARATGWGNQIKAGHYSIESGASNYDMIQKLRRGLQDPVRVSVPPGTRREVLAAVAARDMFFSREELSAVLADPNFAAELDSDTTTLLGYMLPETYMFYWLTPPETVVRRIKEQFDAFYERELRAGADSLNLTKDELITLASIIEWETDLASEKPAVAGVYANRLRIGMKLDADPTVQYAVLASEGRKRRLLNRDYRIDHPFNTYLRAGLPPGPVTNPSRSSLLAAARPDSHQYLYFVANGDGSHTFSRTYDEHLRAARRFHQQMQERRRAAEDA